MSSLTKCDRCGHVAPPENFQPALATTGYGAQFGDRTQVHRLSTGGTELGAEYITENPVDLCEQCRRDLKDFFDNKQVNPGRPA